MSAFIEQYHISFAITTKNTSLDDAEPKLLSGETYLDVLYDEWIMKLKDSGVSKG